ncbi:Uncharacterized protein DAT39_001854, partial [Clarias magur]
GRVVINPAGPSRTHRSIPVLIQFLFFFFFLDPLRMLETLCCLPNPAVSLTHAGGVGGPSDRSTE